MLCHVRGGESHLCTCLSATGPWYNWCQLRYVCLTCPAMCAGAVSCRCCGHPLSLTPSPFSAFVRIRLDHSPPQCGRPLWMTPYVAKQNFKISASEYLISKCAILRVNNHKFSAPHQWRFYVGARGQRPPQILPRPPKFCQGNLVLTLPHVNRLRRKLFKC